MKVKANTALRRNRRLFVRALTSVLFAGIVYSASFGTVHSHGNVSSDLGTNISASSTEQAGALFELPLQSRSDVHECLICVLHRQFSSSIVHAPVFIAGPSAQLIEVSTPAVFYRSSTIVSRPIIRLSGRAPPLRLA